MNNQFNSLGNMIRISNSNLNEFDIVCVDGKNYITESSFINFLDENNITDSKMAFDSIKKSNNIKAFLREPRAQSFQCLYRAFLPLGRRRIRSRTTYRRKNLLRGLSRAHLRICRRSPG